MNFTINRYRNVLNLLIPALLFLALIFIAQSVHAQNNRIMALAISIDLLITVPLVYFLLIRKSKIPKTTLIPVMLLGLAIGSYFLPADQQTYLNWFKMWAIPFVELFVFTFLIIKIRHGIHRYKTQKNDNPDFFDAVKNTCTELIPEKVVPVFATEIAVIYYGLIRWRKMANAERSFSYHRNSGTPALIYGFILVVLMEAIALHFLLWKWNHTAAWILTTLSIYTGLQLLGFAKSMAYRPITLESNKLRLKYGILNETTISIHEIESILWSTSDLNEQDHIARLSPLGALEAHNIIISLKHENQLHGLYGTKKKYKAIALHVDEPERFTVLIQEQLR
ncbi:hypothetical protein GC194_07255 [bacterium]|nr:hypothetical protein [bacterium]